MLILRKCTSRPKTYCSYFVEKNSKIEDHYASTIGTYPRTVTATLLQHASFNNNTMYIDFIAYQYSPALAILCHYTITDTSYKYS